MEVGHVVFAVVNTNPERRVSHVVEVDGACLETLEAVLVAVARVAEYHALEFDVELLLCLALSHTLFRVSIGRVDVIETGAALLTDVLES